MKITGIKRVAGLSKRLTGPYGANYLGVYITMDNPGLWRVWGEEFVDLGRTWRIVPHTDNCISVGIVDTPISMAELKQMVIDKLKNVGRM